MGNDLIYFANNRMNGKGLLRKYTVQVNLASFYSQQHKWCWGHPIVLFGDHVLHIAKGHQCMSVLFSYYFLFPQNLFYPSNHRQDLREYLQIRLGNLQLSWRQIPRPRILSNLVINAVLTLAGESQYDFCFTVSFISVMQVFEVAPSLFMVDVRKAAGDTLEYHKVGCTCLGPHILDILCNTCIILVLLLVFYNL